MAKKNQETVKLTPAQIAARRLRAAAAELRLSSLPPSLQGPAEEIEAIATELDPPAPVEVDPAAGN